MNGFVDLAVHVHHAQIGIGQIDENIHLAQIILDPATALQVDDQLRDAIGDRHVQRGEGSWTDGAVAIEPVTHLKRLDGLCQRIVIECGRVVGVA